MAPLSEFDSLTISIAILCSFTECVRTPQILLFAHREVISIEALSRSIGVSSAPKNQFLDAPIRIGKPKLVNSSKLLTISQLCSGSFENPNPGSRIN